MIDWHHPRIFERLRCFGLALFTLGVASHNEANPPVAVAAIIVATLLVVRLKIELEIGRNEDQPTLDGSSSTFIGSTPWPSVQPYSVP